MSVLCPSCGEELGPGWACVCGFSAFGPDPEQVEHHAVEPPGKLEGERVAFREWTVGEDLGLYSTGVGERWEQEMVADSSRCSGLLDGQLRHERSPDSDCEGCGLHAFYDVPDLLQYANSDTGLAGAVVVSGRTMLGPTGVRAEKARVVLLAYANDRQKALADAASRKLGVGCCALADLERLALEYGQPVPDDEKPEQEGFAAGGLVPNWSNAVVPNWSNAPITLGSPPVARISGNGQALIRNLNLGVPEGRTVEVNGSTGEVAVRVDGEDWEPKSVRERKKLVWRKWLGSLFSVLFGAVAIAALVGTGLSLGKVDSLDDHVSLAVLGCLEALLAVVMWFGPRMLLQEHDEKHRKAES